VTSDPTIEIGPAAGRDVDSVLSAYEWLFAPPGSRPSRWDRARAGDALRSAIGSEDAAVLVARAGHEVVGVCTVYLDIESVRFGRRAWVEDLAVDPAHRSRGIGKGLLDAAKVWAAERGATHLELDSGEARADAHRFYERESPTSRTVCFGWEL
jgi:GNAT superfamily N-acetyltransferase